MASLIDNTWSGQGSLPNAGQENQAKKEFKKWELDMYAGNRHLHNIPQKRKNEKFNNIRKKIYKKHGNIIIPERTISSTGRIVHRNQQTIPHKLNRNQPSSSSSTLSPELVQKIANEKLKEYKRDALDSLTRGLGNQRQTNEILEKLSHDKLVVQSENDKKRDKKMKKAMKKLESSFNTRTKSGSYEKRLKMLERQQGVRDEVLVTPEKKGPKTPTEGQPTRRINTSETKEMAFMDPSLQMYKCGSHGPQGIKRFIRALEIARKVVENLYTKGLTNNKFRTLNTNNPIVEHQLLPQKSVVRFLISLGFGYEGPTHSLDTQKLVYNGDIDVPRLKREVEGIDALLKKGDFDNCPASFKQELKEKEERIAKEKTDEKFLQSRSFRRQRKVKQEYEARRFIQPSYPSLKTWKGRQKTTKKNRDGGRRTRKRRKRRKRRKTKRKKKKSRKRCKSKRKY